MIVEDFTMLGTTVPEPNSDGRVFVCSAGYSRELRQLVRIYPLARKHAPRRWTINRVRLERNPRDSRAESWQVAADRTPGHHDHINDAFEPACSVARPDRAGLLDAVTVGSIAEANAQRLSLAVIHPHREPSLFFEHNPDSPDSPELRLFPVGDESPQGAKRFAFIPRLGFTDDGGDHALMLRDWGCFEFMRKHGDGRRHELGRALHIGAESSLLVGNISNQRTAWLVISVLNGLRSPQQSLFESELMTNGAPA